MAGCYLQLEYFTLSVLKSEVGCLGTINGHKVYSNEDPEKVKKELLLILESKLSKLLKEIGDVLDQDPPGNGVWTIVSS